MLDAKRKIPSKSKYIKQMACMCFVYDVNFRKLAEYHELSVAKVLLRRRTAFWPEIPATYELIEMMAVQSTTCSG